MFSKHKSKISNVNSQIDVFPLQEITNDPNLLNNLTYSEKAVLKFILLLSSKHKIVRPCHRTIAKRSGISIRHVKRCIEKLKELGLLMTIYRGYTSLIYKISSWFLNYNVTKQLSYLFPILKTFCLISVFSIQSEYVLQCIKSSSSFPSSLTNTYLYNTTRLLNVSTCVEEQETKNVKNYKDATQVTKKIVNKNNDFSLKKELEMLSKIKEALQLGEHETTELSKFDDKVLQDAYKVLSNSHDVKYKYKFLLGVCKKIVERKGSQAKKVETKEKINAPWLPSAPAPWISKSFDENMMAWELYAMSPEVKAYEAHFNEYGRDQIILQRERYYTALDKQVNMDPQTKERKAKTALQMQEAFPYTKEGIQDLGKLFGIKPESTTTNEVALEQPKTQEEKKDSPKENVVSITKKEYGIIKDSGDIWEFIPNNHKDYKKYEEELTYNPFDEIEDLDSPLLL